MHWKSTGKPAYQKLGDAECDWWVSLDSTFVTESEELNPLNKKMETVYTLRPESDKALYKKDKKGNVTTDLNRFGFRWTDQQVYEYYKDVMTFNHH